MKSLVSRLVLVLPVLLLSCSLQAPEVKVTGERSMLEKQMLGRYQAFQQELWLQGSLRDFPDTTLSDGGRGKLLRALRRRRYNMDDRHDLLGRGLLAESSEARLVPAPNAIIPPEDEALALRIMSQENEDRLQLLARLQLLHPELEDAALQEVFRGLLRDESPRGSWHQDENGNWKRK